MPLKGVEEDRFVRYLNALGGKALQVHLHPPHAFIADGHVAELRQIEVRRSTPC